jgi:hypothetical protein
MGQYIKIPLSLIEATTFTVLKPSFTYYYYYYYYYQKDDRANTGNFLTN